MKKCFYLLSITLLLAGCNKENYTQVASHTSSFIVNGTVVSPLYTDCYVNMYLNNSMLDNKQTYIDGFDKIIKDVHKQADRYNNYYDRTNIKTLNDSYGSNNEIEIDNYLYNILKTGVEMTNLTDGYFNIGIGNLIDVWKDKFYLPGIYQDDVDFQLVSDALKDVPTIEEVNKLFTFNEDNTKVTFNKIEGKDVVISLGGIAKGYAMDLAKNYLNENSVNAIISAGGSSIATVNKHPINDNWTIALKLPIISYYEIEIAFNISLSQDYSISTSGDNEQNFLLLNEDGSTTIRHHILNPYTGYSSNYHNQVFVISNDVSGMVLDAISTALMNIESIDEIKKIVEKVEKYYNCNLNYAIFNSVDANNTYNVYVTSGLKKLISSDLSDKITKLSVI